jgi:sulfur-carrier protein
MSTTVRVLFFATARGAVGHAALDWPVPSEGASVRSIVTGLGRKYPALARVARSSRFVRNGEYVRRLSDRVRPGDELAIHPPYSGG